jgi:hypothetical protein
MAGCGWLAAWLAHAAGLAAAASDARAAMRLLRRLTAHAAAGWLAAAAGRPPNAPPARNVPLYGRRCRFDSSLVTLIVRVGWVCMPSPLAAHRPAHHVDGQPQQASPPAAATQ